MPMNCIERVLVATPSLDGARERWKQAGFAVCPEEARYSGLRFARCAAGAIEIDLCAATGDASNPLIDAVARATARGGGMVGWIWGVDSEEPRTDGAIEVPGSNTAISACPLAQSLTGVFTAAVAVNSDQNERRRLCRTLCGENTNTVDYLEHIVVMVPVLEDAIAAQEAIGVPCKRIREVGNGMRQAFFKLEQTVIEVVGPAREPFGCWGLAFMCTDIAKAVAVARQNDLQATEPKKAIQGGLIARIVEPLDGVAIAYMQEPLTSSGGG
jgi:hypothetical protein